MLEWNAEQQQSRPEAIGIYSWKPTHLEAWETLDACSPTVARIPMTAEGWSSAVLKTHTFWGCAPIPFHFWWVLFVVLCRMFYLPVPSSWVKQFYAAKQTIWMPCKFDIFRHVNQWTVAFRGKKLEKERGEIEKLELPNWFRNRKDQEHFGLFIRS